MNTFISVSAFLSVAFALVGAIPYWYSVIQGNTKPHQFSWLIFTLLNGIVLLSQFYAGATVSLWVSGASFTVSLINFILAMLRGSRNTSRYDTFLFILSLLTIAIWILTQNPEVAIWLTVVIDIFATAMILLKIKVMPKSEAVLPWSLFTLAFTCSCLTLIQTPPSIVYVRPIYGFLSCAIVATYAIYRQKVKGS